MNDLFLEVYRDISLCRSETELVSVSRRVQDIVEGEGDIPDRDTIDLILALKTKANEFALANISLMIDTMVFADELGIGVDDYDREAENMKTEMTDSLEDLKGGSVLSMENFSKRLEKGLEEESDDDQDDTDEDT